MFYAGDASDPHQPAQAGPEATGQPTPRLARSPERHVTAPARGGAGPAYDLLLHRALAVAAQAEERLAQQRARIEELEKLVTTDELTGTRNRRGFFDHFRRALAEAARQGTQGVLVLVDLNGFKQVNDELGHVAGDRVLARVGEELNRRTRESDVVARLGGDEFAVLMPAAGEADGLARARTIVEAVNRTHCDYAGQRIPIRAAYGAQAFDGTRDLESVLAAADAKLYRDKRGTARDSATTD